MFEWLLFQAQHGATTETLHISRTRATRETQPHSHGRHQPPFPPFPPMHKTTRGKLHRSRIRMDVQRPPHPPPSPPMHRAERETVNIRMDVISPPPSPPPHQCTEQEAKQPHHQPSPAPLPHFCTEVKYTWKFKLACAKSRGPADMLGKPTTDHQQRQTTAETTIYNNSSQSRLTTT